MDTEVQIEREAIATFLAYLLECENLAEEHYLEENLPLVYLNIIQRYRRLVQRLYDELAYRGIVSKIIIFFVRGLIAILNFLMVYSIYQVESLQQEAEEESEIVEEYRDRLKDVWNLECDRDEESI